MLNPLASALNGENAAESLDLLLRLGANPNGLEAFGKRCVGSIPLHQAVILGKLEFVEALVLAGADPNSVDDNRDISALKLAFARKNDAVYKFLSAVIGREVGVEKTVKSLIEAGPSAPAEQVVEIISNYLGVHRGDPRWNISVLSAAYMLKQDSFDLLTDRVAPLILDGDWSDLRIGLVRRGIAIFANMNIRLIQFEHVAAHFLLIADLKTLAGVEVMSIAARESKSPLNSGYRETQLQYLVRAEGCVGKLMIGAVGVHRTISFFRDFYVRRCAKIEYLRSLPLPDYIILLIEELLYGYSGVIGDLWRSKRSALLSVDTSELWETS